MQIICNFLPIIVCNYLYITSIPNLSLLRVANTIFASSIVIIKHLNDVKTTLEKIMMDYDWKVLLGCKYFK